jgi:hypothetical protein
VTCDGSPAATALAADRGTLSEHRPVVADIHNLSALTGVRAGMVEDPLSTKERRRVSIAPQNQRRAGRSATHLKLDNPRFLFLEGWGASPLHLPAPLWCLLAPPMTARRQAAPPASGTNSTAAPSARGDGAWVPTCRRWSAPHHFPPPRPMMNSPTPVEGRTLATRATCTPHYVVPGAPAA